METHGDSEGGQEDAAATPAGGSAMDMEGDGSEGPGVRGDEEQEVESTKHLCFLFEALEVRGVCGGGRGTGVVGLPERVRVGEGRGGKKLTI